jgi:hypothetical protein
LKEKSRRNRTSLPLILLGALSSCHPGIDPAEESRGVSPEGHAHALLVNLAVLNPRLAEPLVKGVSAAAMERALGLVVAIGVENAGWAEGLLNRAWWLPGESGVPVHQPRAVEEVLSEVRRVGSDTGVTGEDRERRAQEAIADEAVPLDGSRRDTGTGATKDAPAPEKGFRSSPAPGPGERRAELEDAVRWVQYTEAWSSYYEAARVASFQGPLSTSGSETLLDQAVTMSLVRPDFLDRLATLVAEGLGS